MDSSDVEKLPPGQRQHQLDRLYKLRSHCKGRLTQFENFLSSHLIVSQIPSRLKVLRDVFAKYDDVQLEIDQLHHPQGEPGEHRTEFEERYYGLVQRAQSMFDAVIPKSSTSTLIQNSPSNVNQPPQAQAASTPLPQLNPHAVEFQSSRRGAGPGSRTSMHSSRRRSRSSSSSSRRSRSHSSRSRHSVAAIHNNIEAPPDTGVCDLNLQPRFTRAYARRPRLPTLTIPVFTGNPQEWDQFFSLFESLVHNSPDLPDIEKWHFLRSYLSGAAARLVEGLPHVAESYSEAIGILKARFENEKLRKHQILASLFNFSANTKDSPYNLFALIDHFKRNVRALKVLKEPVEHWDTVLSYLITTKLDENTHKDWETYSAKLRQAKLEDLYNFLQLRATCLSNVAADKKSRDKVNCNRLSSKPKGRTFVASATEKCPCCSQVHVLKRCKVFTSKSVREKYEFLKSHRLCFNCFSSSHVNADCKSKPCSKCGKKHHILLHKESVNVVQDEEVNVVEVQAINAHIINNFASKALLSTVKILVKDGEGKLVKCRALLDSGSTHTLISDQAVKRLKLKTVGASVSITGVGGIVNNSLKATALRIADCHSRGYSIKLNALVVQKLTSDIPCVKIDRKALSIPKHIKLADPDFDAPAQIDVLLGADIFWSCLQTRKIKLPHSHVGRICLKETRFGYIITGTLFNPSTAKVSICNLSIDQINFEKFWESEELQPRTDQKTDSYCEELFSATTIRTSQGQYQVEYPFVENETQFPPSRSHALKGFLAIEQKLSRDPQLKEKYVKFMNDYLELNHMELAPNHLADGGDVYYVRHHPVFKDGKIRIVFNPTFRPEGQMSLNERMMPGPVVQLELVNILLNFRLGHTAFTSDIEKFYRQVLITPKQRDLQRIFWRSDKTQPLKVYRLKTVTYGLTPSAFLSTRALIQAALDYEDRFPLGAKLIKSSFYVDDFVYSTSDEPFAIDSINQMLNILKNTHFPLTSWRSNNPNILKQLDVTSAVNPIAIVDKGTDKTLGIMWDSELDNLIFTFTSSEFLPTKRNILSQICKLFDPLGLLSPCIVPAKVLMQKIWISKTEWDVEVPQEILIEWTRFYEQLKNINNFPIPRWVKTNGNNVLHIFCDASKNAYAAVAYAVTRESSMLLASKTKVAPIKNALTIPRLELCAALLGARLAFKITSHSTLQWETLVFWTDAKIILYWLSQTPNRWQNFVANRVLKIHDLTKNYNWFHVPSALNPADIASRGASINVLKSNNLWWHGPPFLLQPRSEWPPQQLESTALEVKVCATVSKAPSPPTSFLDKYSSYEKLKRITAWILRFINRARKLAQVDKKYHSGLVALNISEMIEAEIKLLKIAQSSAFSQEIANLIENKQLFKKSSLLPLVPFLDSDGLLRVGGRIQLSDVLTDQKHPIILPSKHSITRLLINTLHKKHHHLGPTALLGLIRTRFWPLQGLRTVKSAIKSCVICFRYSPKTTEQLMAPLPECRVQQSAPFQHTGLDYAGPFLSKTSPSSSTQEKVYILILTCMATRAIHLELVISATTANFLLALRRFIARRGKPQTLYSDNAETFKGAQRQISEWLGLQNKSVPEEWKSFLIDNHIEWRYIPPHAPHHGGVWERMVKAVKSLLHKTTQMKILDYERFSTLLIEVEALLNSKPLCAISDSPDDFEALTPAHFLLGRPLLTLALPPPSQTITKSLNMFQAIQAQRAAFWKRWSLEYLAELQTRAKWHTDCLDLAVGQLVIIKTEGLPPMQWPLARVVEIFPGRDRRIRVARLKTPKGTLTRPLSKICPLPPASDPDNLCRIPVQSKYTRSLL